MANTPYAELGKKADALVTLYYRKPDEDQLNDILKLAQTCVECYIHSAVYSSRSGEGGVPAYIDPGDILNTTLGNIARAVKEKRYTVGTFNGYAVTVAKRAFLDTMKRKQLPYERGSDEEQEEKSERPHARTEEPQAYCDQAAVVAMEREILNAVLDAERALANETEAAIWVGRVFLGHSDKDLCAIFDLKQDTLKSHFRRACLGIHRHFCALSGYAEAQFGGLKTFVQSKMDLRESDVGLVKDPTHKKALRLALRPPLSVGDLADGLRQEPRQALQTLRDALISLSKAKVKRAKPVLPTVKDPRLDEWLWQSVDKALALYPDMAPATRASIAPDPGAQELADLCAVAVALGFSGDSEKRQSLGELLTSRAGDDPIALAKGLGITEDILMAILSDTAAPNRLTPGLLKRVMKRFDIPEPVLAAALRTPPQGQSSPTRGLSGAERERYYERLRRNALKV